MSTQNKTETLLTAMSAYDAAVAAFREHAPQFPKDVPETPEWEAQEARLVVAVNAAKASVDAARAALVGSDCPRPFDLSEGGENYDQKMFSSAEEALRAAVDGVVRSNYDFADGSALYIDVRVVCALTGEVGSETVVLSVPEPECKDGFEHDWRRPIEVVGGCSENPGVFANGGGVITHEVCAHCGRYRSEDTWAQHPETGEQGLHVVTYKEPDVESLAWIAELRGEDVADD